MRFGCCKPEKAAYSKLFPMTAPVSHTVTSKKYVFSQSNSWLNAKPCLIQIVRLCVKPVICVLYWTVIHA